MLSVLQGHGMPCPYIAKTRIRLEFTANGNEKVQKYRYPENGGNTVFTDVSGRSH